MGRAAAAGAFAACVLGAIYAAMLLGCWAHEVLGHGTVAVAAGGRFVAFDVSPAAHGTCWYDGVPDRLWWIPLWAGIGVNLLCGAAAVAASRLRPSISGHAALALLAVGTANGGQALGYALQGAFSGHGDAAALRTLLDPAPRAAAIAALAAAYLLLLDWSMGRLALLLAVQSAPGDGAVRRRWFLATVLLPFALLAASRPPSTVFEPGVDWASRAVLVSVVGAWGCRRAGSAPAPPPDALPLGWRGAGAWLLGAAALGAVTAAWAADGIRVGW